MAVTLPVPVGFGRPPAGSGLTWIEIGAGAKPARVSAARAASRSGTKCAMWSRKTSSPIGNWRSTSERPGVIESLRILKLAAGQIAGRGRTRRGRAPFDVPIPVDEHRGRDHRENPGHADRYVHAGPARGLDDDEMPREREELAKAEDLQRMLAAADDR